MTRREEWDALLREADGTPASLPQTIDQAVARAARRESRSRRLRGALVTLTGLAAAFVVLVNTSIPFALAAGRVPLLRPLVEAVALNPSLKAAVAHEYVQLVGQDYEQDGVRLRIEYLIADPRNLTVFYTLEDAAGRPLHLHPDLCSADGTELGAGVSYGEELTGLSAQELTDPEIVRRQQREIHKWSFVLTDQTSGVVMPETVRVQVKVYLNDLDQVNVPTGTVFDVPLTIEPRFLRAVRTFPVGQSVDVLGQRVEIERIEVYPTNTRIVWRTAPDNTGWLTWLPFYLTDQNGVRVDGVANGFSGVGSDQWGGWGETWLESAWFDTADRLTLHIDEAAVLPKQGVQVTLHADGRAEGLPDYIWQTEEDWLLEEVPAGSRVRNFAVACGTYDSTTDVLGETYTDANGTTFDTFTYMGTSMSFDGREDGADFVCNYGFAPEAVWPVTVTLRFAPGQRLETPVILAVTE